MTFPSTVPPLNSGYPKLILRSLEMAGETTGSIWLDDIKLATIAYTSSDARAALVAYIARLARDALT